MLLTSNQKLSIPLPRPTQNVNRGLGSNRVAELKPISTRWTDEDRLFIDRMANKLGMSFSEFVRWCAYFSAVEVSRLEHIDSFKIKEPEVKQPVDLSDWD
jgi:uncharacterized protein (DUF1778 family)